MGFPLIFVFLFAYTFFFLLCPKRFRKDFKSEKGAFTNLIVRGNFQVPGFIFSQKLLRKPEIPTRFTPLSDCATGGTFTFTIIVIIIFQRISLPASRGQCFALWKAIPVLVDDSVILSMH